VKISRDDKTWLYTVTDDDGGSRILPSVTTIIDAALEQFRGFDTNQFTEMFRDIEMGNREKVSQITAGVVTLMNKVINAGQFGSAVHILTAMDDQDILDEDALDPALIPILTAWRKFKAVHQPVMFCAEFRVASRLGYAGTVDRVAAMDGKPSILEIKSRPYKSGRDDLQTIAYQKAYEEITKTKISKRFVVELSLDGDFSITENKNAMDWDMFRSAMALFNWRKNHEL
jgi:hypothetical protein